MTLADEIMLEKLAGVRSRQEAHQTLYLKNLLHTELGLPHTLTFDLHTETLPSGLVKATPKEILTSVLSFLTLPKLVECVKKAINEAMDIKRIPYGVLNQYFEEKAPLASVEDFFVFNEAYEPLGISDAAAMAILTSMGYVEEKI